MNPKAALLFCLLLLAFFGERIFRNFPDFLRVAPVYTDAPIITESVQLVKNRNLSEFSTSEGMNSKNNPWVYQQVSFQLWPIKYNPVSKILLKLKTEKMMNCDLIESENEVELVQCK
jgi:hypothetical protein